MNTLDSETNVAISPDLFELEIATTIHERVDYGKRSRFVTFYCGDKLYGVAAAEVAEVVHPLPVSPFPNGPDTLIGISALRGEIVALVDLQKVLSETSQRSQGRSKFILLRSAENETKPAFSVDRMHEIVSVSDDHISRGGISAPGIAGEADINGTVLHIIDVRVITAAIAE